MLIIIKIFSGLYDTPLGGIASIQPLRAALERVQLEEVTCKSYLQVRREGKAEYSLQSIKAETACEIFCHSNLDHFVDVNKMVDFGSDSQREVGIMNFKFSKAKMTSYSKLEILCSKLKIRNSL